MKHPAPVETRFPFTTLNSDRRWIDAYWEMGYVVITGVFTGPEIETMQRRFDRWYAEGMRHPSTFRHQNKVIWLEQDETVGKIVRGMQWSRCGRPIPSMAAASIPPTTTPADSTSTATSSRKTAIEGNGSFAAADRPPSIYTTRP